MIFISWSGRSCASVGTSPMCFTMPMPSLTRPKMVCFPISHSLITVVPSSHGVGASVMKNWQPFVFGPEFAYP